MKTLRYNGQAQSKQYWIPVLALLAMMDMDIIFGQVAKYGTYNTTKSSLHNRYTRLMKAMLPRKRTSNLRILQNRGWNQEEDSCYIRITHFSKLDFCNEINDNSLNEAIALNQLKKDLLRITNAPDVCPTIDDLTPPATPFGSSVSFLYDSSPILSNVPSLPHQKPCHWLLLPLVVSLMYLPSKTVMYLSLFPYLIVGHCSYRASWPEYNVYTNTL